MTKFHQNYLTNQIFCGIIILVIIYHAGVVKLADTQDLGSCAARCAGSSPVTRTKGKVTKCNFACIFIKFHSRRSLFEEK